MVRKEQNVHFHNFLKALNIPSANKYIRSTKEPSFSIPHKKNAGKKPSQNPVVVECIQNINKFSFAADRCFS